MMLGFSPALFACYIRDENRTFGSTSLTASA
jgi:hypothetical protein